MNRKQALKCLMMLILLGSVCGCSTVGDYLTNRGADLADILTAELNVGPGLDAHAQVTGYLGCVVGWSRQRGLMLHGRCVGVAKRNSLGYLIVGSSGASLRDTKPMCGDPEYCSDYWGQDRGRYWGFFLPYKDSVLDWPRNFDIEIGGSAILVGAHVGLSPGEFLDFLTGLLFIDIAGDDYHPSREEPEQPQPGPAQDEH